MTAAQTRLGTTLLLVDDEENILKSLRRLLRHEPYDILIAQGAEQALQLLGQTPVDLVISDARMPGMDGATLLSEVQQRWPGCVRILLTGQADLSTTIKAINQGQIYRYISKPWNDQELRLTIRQALAFQHSERERERLAQLTREQNRRLEELNSRLEQRVLARSEELQQTAAMLDLAYAELRCSYVTSTEVFSSLLAQRIARDQQSNGQVIALVRAYCERQAVDEHSSRDLAMAAALYNLGKLTWSDSLLSSPADLLYKQQRERYRQYPVLGESLLMSLEPLQDAARLIRHHQERWDGGGFPDRLKGEAIPFGSRLLKLAVDFSELQSGLVLDRRLSRDQALLLIRKYSGKLYDPQLCERFINLCTERAPDLVPADPGVLVLDTRRLQAGMLLARNLYAQNGTLLLNEGKQLSRALIDKLIAFEESEGARYRLWVRPVPQTSTSAEEAVG